LRELRNQQALSLGREHVKKKREQSTFNAQHSTPAPQSEHDQAPDVECSTLNVEWSPASPGWLILDSGPGDPFFNMALDEALLEAVARLRKPVLRFYGWTEPAASFGYFQKYREVERLTLLRPLVRRPTGGGLVPHDADWTYSLAFPANHEWYSLKAIESYRRVHEWIQAAFARLDIATELAPGSRKAAPGQCFVGYETFDVLWRGRKIAGAAQRRTRSGLLIQGSVQPPLLSLTRADWEKAMCDAHRPSPRREWVDFELDVLLREQTEALIRQKYSRAGYHQKR
jgi:lipoyl(octanoyl) transferase